MVVGWWLREWDRDPWGCLVLAGVVALALTVWGGVLAWFGW